MSPGDMVLFSNLVGALWSHIAENENHDDEDGTAWQGASLLVLLLSVF